MSFCVKVNEALNFKKFDKFNFCKTFKMWV